MQVTCCQRWKLSTQQTCSFSRPIQVAHALKQRTLNAKHDSAPLAAGAGRHVGVSLTLFSAAPMPWKP
jgi:hypothetical protein